METREMLFALLRSEIMGEAVEKEAIASLTLDGAAALLPLQILEEAALLPLHPGGPSCGAPSSARSASSATSTR